jgi:predicted HTH domain antitoxin
VNISFELPQDIEHEITADGANLNADAEEAYLVDLYRQHKVSHYQISQALGLSRYETDGVLKKHGVGLGISPEEMRAQSESLRKALREARPE